MSRVLLIVGLSISLLLLVSCGGGIGGGAADFNTVMVTASIGTNDIDSDIAAHTAVATCGVVGSDSITIPAADSVDVVIQSSVYSGKTTSIPASSVQIAGATVSYTPISDPNTGIVGPALGDRVYYPSGQIIAPGASVQVPIRVGFQEIKEFLFNSLVCSGPIYTYKATINVTVVEMNTNVSKNFSVSTIVRFADFSDA